MANKSSFIMQTSLWIQNFIGLVRVLIWVNSIFIYLCIYLFMYLFIEYCYTYNIVYIIEISMYNKWWTDVSTVYAIIFMVVCRNKSIYSSNLNLFIEFFVYVYSAWSLGKDIGFWIVVWKLICRLIVYLLSEQTWKL